MQIERMNASNLLLGIIVIAIQCGWAIVACAQTSGSLPIPPQFTTAAALTSIIPLNGSRPPESTVVTIDPNQLVLYAIHQSVWGPPLACKVYQRSRAFDQHVIVSGDYKASGLGTGQFRRNARVSSGETTLDEIQVSDGRVMFTQLGLDESPKRVHLDQIRQAIGNAIHHAGERPEVNFYLAIGGHPELLRCLYHRYFWYKAITRTINGVDVWQLEGRLRTDPPKLLGNTRLDQSMIGPVPRDSNLPTEVRLTLGRSASAAYFPYMIEYFQRVKSKDGQTVTTELRSVLEHSELTTTVTIVDKDFVFREQDGVATPENETDLYMPTAPIADRATFPFR